MIFVWIFIGFISFLFFLFYDWIDNYFVDIITKSENDRLNKMKPYINHDKLQVLANKNFGYVIDHGLYECVSEVIYNKYCDSHDVDDLSIYELGYLKGKFRQFIGYNIQGNSNKVRIHIGVNYTNSNIISVRKFTDEWYLIQINSYDNNLLTISGGRIYHFHFKCDSFDGVKNLIEGIL